MARSPRRAGTGRGLAQTHVAIVGVGGLGAAAARQLAVAGVGRLTLFDPDRVEASNLPRQTLYRDADIGGWKVDRAADRLRAIAAHLDVRPCIARIDAGNVVAELAEVDIVIDGTDSPAAKALLNSALCRMSLPFVHAGVIGSRGQLLSVLPGRSACLQCVFAEIGEEDAGGCARAGVLPGLPATFGALQAAEAARFAASGDFAFRDRLLRYEARSRRWQIATATRTASCAACAAAPANRTPSSQQLARRR